MYIFYLFFFFFFLKFEWIRESYEGGMEGVGGLYRKRKVGSDVKMEYLKMVGGCRNQKTPTGHGCVTVNGIFYKHILNIYSCSKCIIYTYKNNYNNHCFKVFFYKITKKIRKTTKIANNF